MSAPPNPPARLEAKTSVRPSLDRLGCCPAAVEFSGAPRFVGGDQESCTLRRGGGDGREAGGAPRAPPTTTRILHPPAAGHPPRRRGGPDPGRPPTPLRAAGGSC